MEINFVKIIYVCIFCVEFFCLMFINNTVCEDKHKNKTVSVPVAYRGGGLVFSNPPRNSEDFGVVLDRMSKKNRRLDFLSQFTVFSTVVIY